MNVTSSKIDKIAIWGQHTIEGQIQIFNFKYFLRIFHNFHWILRNETAYVISLQIH